MPDSAMADSRAIVALFGVPFFRPLPGTFCRFAVSSTFSPPCHGSIGDGEPARDFHRPLTRTEPLELAAGHGLVLLLRFPAVLPSASRRPNPIP